MKTYVTADHHFNHVNIIKYTGRPFADVVEMNDELVNRYNARVKAEDQVFFLGDSQFYKQGALDYVSLLRGQKIFVRGNHDRSLLIRSLTIRYNGLLIGMMHNPEHALVEVDLNLCGHVHEVWKSSWRHGRPVINVGVDVWEFAPVLLDEIVQYYRQIKTNQPIS
jgi:calcineurin-like phosphoesterase family protein